LGRTESKTFYLFRSALNQSISRVVGQPLLAVRLGLPEIVRDSQNCLSYREAHDLHLNYEEASG